MISRLSTFGSHDTLPYKNLATEEYLTKTAAPGEMILFLWQNRRTVVIGRNQNCFAECDVQALREDGGFLARRLSGGGAVFHDTKNLNFSFCVRRPDYDVERQTEVILRAAGLLGANASRMGRNDITADGRKFSGHAYFRTGDACCHHGTILIDTDSTLMSRYLCPDSEKLRQKGVASVRSRVCNLKEFNPDITVEEVKKALIQASEEVYGIASDALDHLVKEEEISSGAERFSSREWIYGRNLPFDHSFGRRFPWGNITFELKVKGSCIETVRLWSDAMDPVVIQTFEQALTGCEYDVPKMCDAIAHAATGESIAGADIALMKSDVSGLIRESM